MISLHSILALEGAMQKLPKIFGIVAVVLIAIAFTIGFLKGFRKVSWDGLTWAMAGTVFLFVSRSINPEGSVTKRFVYAMLIALACIAGVLALHGLMAYYLRPRIRWVKDNVNGDTTLAEYGLEFEPEYLDYDGENDWQPYGKRLYKTGFTPPNFAFRLFGGIAGAFNAGMILWMLASMWLMFVNSAEFVKPSMLSVLEDEFAQTLLNIAQKSLFEMISIGVVLLVAKRGYGNGWLNTIRMLILTFGSLAALIGCMYLPFTDAANEGIVGTFVGKCISVVEGKVPVFGDVIGKLLAGTILASFSVILIASTNIILRKCCRLVSKTTPTRIVDTILSCLLYLIIGAIACLVIWFTFAALDYVDLFHLGESLQDGAHLSNGLYNFARALVEKLVNR